MSTRNTGRPIGRLRRRSSRWRRGSECGERGTAPSHHSAPSRVQTNRCRPLRPACRPTPRSHQSACRRNDGSRRTRRRPGRRDRCHRLWRPDFVYFSFFLVVSALLLTSLFTLAVEERLREVGLLRGRFGRGDVVASSFSRAPCSPWGQPAWYPRGDWVCRTPDAGTAHVVGRCGGDDGAAAACHVAAALRRRVHGHFRSDRLHLVDAALPSRGMRGRAC